MASSATHFLTIPPSRESAEQHLLPGLRAWFAETIGEPTLAQRFGLFGGAHVPDGEPNARMTLRELAEDLDEDIQVGRPGYGHDQLSSFTLANTLRDT